MKSIKLLQEFTSIYEKLVNTPYNIEGELLYAVEVNLIVLFAQRSDIGVALLSQELSVTKSAVSQKIHRMCEKGYLEFDCQKGRNKYYRLTEKGEKINRIHSLLQKKTIDSLESLFLSLDHEEQLIFDSVIEKLTGLFENLDYQKKLDEVAENV